VLLDPPTPVHKRPPDKILLYHSLTRALSLFDPLPTIYISSLFQQWASKPRASANHEDERDAAESSNNEPVASNAYDSTSSSIPVSPSSFRTVVQSILSRRVVSRRIHVPSLLRHVTLTQLNVCLSVRRVRLFHTRGFRVIKVAAGPLPVVSPHRPALRALLRRHATARIRTRRIIKQLRAIARNQRHARRQARTVAAASPTSAAPSHVCMPTVTEQPNSIILPPAASPLPPEWHIPAVSERLPVPASYAPNFTTRSLPLDERPTNIQPGRNQQINGHPLPIYTPVTVRGPNGRVVDVFAFTDSGSDISIMSPAFAQLLGCGVSAAPGVTHVASGATVPRQTVTQFVYFWCSSFSCQARPDVLDLPVADIPYVLLGRDLMAAFNISVSGVPISFATDDRSRDNDDFIDLSVRASRLSDSVDLSETEEAMRNLLRDNVTQQLHSHSQQVPIISFISHPAAVVQLFYNTPNPQIKTFKHGQESHKSKQGEYITKQVAYWLENGKIVPWDPLIHGSHPKHVMPLIPVVTYLPNGDIHKVRVCTDSRALNAVLINDDFPIPNINILYEKLRGYKFYSELDAVSCFNQFPISQETQHVAAIRWDGKVYAWAGAPFGIKFLSSHVQRVFQTIFADLPFVAIFVDNFVIASNSLEEHAEHLRIFIDRCTQYNIKLDPVKSKLALTSITTLGNVLTATGISPDPQKVAEVMSWPVPTNSKAVSQFLGFANYLRHYIRHFADISAPLDALRNIKHQRDFVWSTEAATAFQTLKHAVAHAPSLCFYDSAKPLALAVDASQVGIGCVVFQPRFDGDLPCAENIISFASRSLKKYERNYSPYVSELNGLVFGLKHFEDLLWGRTFQVLTDHKALQYLHTQQNLNRTLQGWLTLILQYDFSIQHLPGYQNVLPDALSRKYPTVWGAFDFSSPPTADVSTHAVSTHSKVTWADSVDGQSLTSYIEFDRDAPVSFLPNSPPFHPDSNHDVPDTVVLSPDDLRALVEKIHIEDGHFGRNSVLASLKRRGLVFQGMAKMVQQICSNCPTCQKWTRTRKMYHPISSPTAAIPFDFLQIDLISSFAQDNAPSGDKYILIITDVFSSFCLLRPLKEKTAIAVARELLDVFTTFGPCRTLQSDNGGEFAAEVIQKLTEAAGVKHRFTLAYTPRSAGKVERHVDIVSSVLRKTMHEYQCPWPVALPFTQLQVNLNHKNLTNSSPFALVFNRVANDWVPYTHLAARSISDDDHAAWLERQKVLIDEIFPGVRDRTLISKQNSNSKFKSNQTSLTKFKEGSLVMVEDLSRSSKSKPLYLGPYTIVRISPTGSYTLRAFDGSFFPRDVPRDVLKPINSDFLKPVEDALNNQFYVANIKGHRPAADGSLELLVSWANGDDDSWIPLDLVDNAELLRDYITTVRHRQPGNALPAFADVARLFSPDDIAPSPSPTKRARRKSKKRQTAVTTPAVSPAEAPVAASVPANGKRRRQPNSRLRDYR
jgi:transposase InsO family protein